MSALDRLMAALAPRLESDDAAAPWIRMGNRVLGGLLVGVLLFSFVSISGAVVATGVVNVETNYKMVQHLDGGIVSKILVRNGDLVKEGDVLMRLEDTQARANLAVSVAKMNDLLVQQARLEAERDSIPDMILPKDVVAAQKDPALAKIIAAQRSLFEARVTAHRGELSLLRQRVEQSRSEAAGTGKLLDARKKESALSASELATVKPLYDRGFANAQRLMPIQRENARLEGEVGRLMSDLAKAQSSVGEAELKLAQSEKDYMQAVVDELRKVQASLAEVTEQRLALEDKLRRIEIRAPRSGHVHALAVHTEGGVITPGTPIMQIIPDGERLVIDAQLQPQDIDKVHKGQAAYIRFPAFNAKTTPRFTASVLTVSAAQITDNQNKSYFTAQVALAEGELEKLPKMHTLVPGMPAEVFIETGNRSIMSYFIKPLIDAVSRTFRET